LICVVRTTTPCVHVVAHKFSILEPENYFMTEKLELHKMDIRSYI
jgi:hypothetical protein